MDPNKLQAMLGNVSGHLKIGVLRDDHQLQSLHRSLARSLFAEDVQQLKTSSFTFENSDLFSPQQIPADLSDALRSVAEQSTAPAAEPEFRAFVRELPVRTTQLPASAPLWSAGAAVDHTIGPFTNKDGRQFWFDFFRIEKLAALYIQGQPDPALLFKTTRRLQFIDPMLPPILDPAPSYNLPAGSIWINSRIFAANAPAATFIGLTIAGGTIKLGAPPQLINGRLTIAPGTVVTAQLRLQQPVVGGDTTSPYGADARAATLQLPGRLSFHFSGQGAQLDEISSARWNV